MSKTVAEVIVDVLIKAGARRCYGIVGDTINHFTDAVRRSDLAWVHVRHEEVGALAAGGESYMTGELSVCAGTAGPGTLHFINGIVESHRNGAPVILIASNINRLEAGLGFPQDMDQRKIYEQYSVFCEYVSHPDQACRIATMAVQAALTRKGVAVLIVNGDMFQEKTHDELAWSVHRPAPVLRPNDAELDQLAGMIDAAANITLYVGIGARGAHDQVVALAAKLKAPVAHTSRSKEFIEPNNPFNVGMTGILGNKAGLHAVSNCDLLICLGTDFAYTQFYPAKANVVQIDTDATHIGRRSPVHLGLVGDVGDTIDALLPRLGDARSDSWLLTSREQWHSDVNDYLDKAHEPDPALIHPQYVTQMLDRLAAADALFTADGGSPMVWLLRHLSTNGKRRFLTSLLHGTMANAYPQAIGMALAYPDRQVIALCGDGGMTMLMGDLLTLVQEKVAVKILLFNNGALGFVEMEQRIEGLLDSFTELKNPDFAEVARNCGLWGARVTDARTLEKDMTAWLAADGPALLDVKVNRMELIMPPEIEAGEVASTALFGVKAVLSGRMGEAFSLLRDNFLR